MAKKKKSYSKYKIPDNIRNCVNVQMSRTFHYDVELAKNAKVKPSYTKEDILYRYVCALTFLHQDCPESLYDVHNIGVYEKYGYALINDYGVTFSQIKKIYNANKIEVSEHTRPVVEKHLHLEEVKQKDLENKKKAEIKKKDQEFRGRFLNLIKENNTEYDYILRFKNLFVERYNDAIYKETFVPKFDCGCVLQYEYVPSKKEVVWKYCKILDDGYSGIGDMLIHFIDREIEYSRIKDIEPIISTIEEALDYKLELKRVVNENRISIIQNAENSDVLKYSSETLFKCLIKNYGDIQFELNRAPGNEINTRISDVSIKDNKLRIHLIIQQYGMNFQKDLTYDEFIALKDEPMKITNNLIIQFSEKTIAKTLKSFYMYMFDEKFYNKYTIAKNLKNDVMFNYKKHAQMKISNIDNDDRIEILKKEVRRGDILYSDGKQLYLIYEVINPNIKPFAVCIQTHFDTNDGQPVFALLDNINFGLYYQYEDYYVYNPNNIIKEFHNKYESKYDITMFTPTCNDIRGLTRAELSKNKEDIQQIFFGITEDQDKDENFRLLFMCGPAKGTVLVYDYYNNRDFEISVPSSPNSNYEILRYISFFKLGRMEK